MGRACGGRGHHAWLKIPSDGRTGQLAEALGHCLSAKNRPRKEGHPDFTHEVEAQNMRNELILGSGGKLYGPCQSVCHPPIPTASSSRKYLGINLGQILGQRLSVCIWWRVAQRSSRLAVGQI